MGMASVADEASSADGEHPWEVLAGPGLGSMPTALVRNRTASATSKSALTVTGVRRRNAACTTSIVSDDRMPVEVYRAFGY